MSDFIQTSKLHHYDELLAQYIIERDLARSYETELARLRKIEAAAKRLNTYLDDWLPHLYDRYYLEIKNEIEEALEQK